MPLWLDASPDCRRFRAIRLATHMPHQDVDSQHANNKKAIQPEAYQHAVSHPAFILFINMASHRARMGPEEYS